MFFEDMIFSFVPIFIAIIGIFVFGTIIFILFSSIKKGIKNNNSPRLTVPAEVISKRTHVQGDHSYTTYYVTFEVQSGDRLELQLNGSDFGMLAEKDIGILSFQGTRYVSFERQ
ncbi:DUF2500 domain-containing protein [Kurthia huakuii]|uniref:DUF2500 domain-containing protein n=1 Tax=Kurthia huakuii TaxID=1421019 RepID=UPI000497C221|nr:DUF2500 domain-containing protein [Kurthia huakuii]MBM7699766.1 hypothetical protein [Kurthia huakuii]